MDDGDLTRYFVRCVTCAWLLLVIGVFVAAILTLAELSGPHVAADALVEAAQNVQGEAAMRAAFSRCLTSTANRRAMLMLAVGGAVFVLALVQLGAIRACRERVKGADEGEKRQNKKRDTDS